jgi:diacylglycerol kinase (ATP)
MRALRCLRTTDRIEREVRMPHAPGSVHQAVLFANPRSGRSRRWLWHIIDQCRLQNIEIVSTHFDVRDTYVKRILDAAEQSGLHTVLVAGGDGTVGTISGHLVDTNFTLGVLPAGTSNNFARSLNIPMDVAGAVGVVACGIRTRVDVGRAGERIFAEAAIIGMNTDFARRAQQLRGWIGRLSYPIAAIEAYFRRRRVPVTLTSDGDVRCFNAFEVAFINAPVYAGPLDLAVKEADLTNGKLRVVVVEDMTWRVVARALPRAFQRRSLKMPGIDVFSIRSVRVESAPPIPMTLDGELKSSTPITIEVIPAALRVFAPPSFLAENNASAVQR